MTKEIKKVLMERDGLTSTEAIELIAEAKEQLLDYIDQDDFNAGFDICEEFFGLEPDYLDELMFI